MSDIKERLDKVRALIQEPEFLEGKGLSNEVNIRIFCYEPENEMIVRHFVNQLETDPSLDCHLIVCNLYKTFLSNCDDMDITDKDFEYEKVEQYITHHFDYIDSGASDRVIDWILLGKMPENISNAIKKKQEEIQRMHELDFATGMLVQQDD